MNCTEVHTDFLSTWSLVEHQSWGSFVLLGALAFGSAVLLTSGEKHLKFLATTVGGLAGGAVVFFLVEDTMQSIPCEGRIAITAASSIAISLVCMCLVKTGFAVLGGVGLGTVCHLLWESLPLGSVTGPFQFAGLQGWYIVATAASALAGVVLSATHRKTFGRIVSSLLGGVGIAACVRVVAGESVPTGALLGIAAACCVASTTFQTRRARKGREEGSPSSPSSTSPPAPRKLSA